MKFPTLNENDLPHLPYFGSKVSFRIIWKMLKIVKNQWDGYISSLSFSNQVLFCCKPSNLNEICGNTGNAKIFFFLTYETDDSQRGCPHWDQCQVTWEQFLAATYLKVDPPVRLLEWLFWIQLGLSRGPWDHGAAHSSPGNHSAAPSAKFSPLVFDFQANYLSTAVGKSTHQKQFNFLNCDHLSL